MKIGDVVECLVDLQPLKRGDTGTVKAINYENRFSITVDFVSIGATLPMKLEELKVLK